MTGNEAQSVSKHWLQSIHADKPGRMNAKFSDFTLQHRLFIQSSVHNIQRTNNKKRQFIVEVFEEDSLMIRNNSKVALEL